MFPLGDAPTRSYVGVGGIAAVAFWKQIGRICAGNIWRVGGSCAECGIIDGRSEFIEMIWREVQARRYSTQPIWLTCTMKIQDIIIWSCCWIENNFVNYPCIYVYDLPLTTVYHAPTNTGIRWLLHPRGQCVSNESLLSWYLHVHKQQLLLSPMGCAQGARFGRSSSVWERSFRLWRGCSDSANGNCLRFYTFRKRKILSSNSRSKLNTNSRPTATETIQKFENSNFICPKLLRTPWRTPQNLNLHNTTWSVVINFAVKIPLTMGKHTNPVKTRRTGRVISDERRDNAIALETFVKKGKRYDASKGGLNDFEYPSLPWCWFATAAKDEKYYKKAKLLRSFHRMLKKEGIAESQQPEPEVGSATEETLFKAQASQDAQADIPKQTSKESQTVCKFFISDKGCKNGMQCVYKHDMEQNSSRGKHKLRVCRFFQSRSGCSNGQHCKYMHQSDAGGHKQVRFLTYIICSTSCWRGSLDRSGRNRSSQVNCD